MGAKTLRKRPATREFSVEDLVEAAQPRLGYYAAIFEELKDLAEAKKGLLVEFASDSAGGAALKRLADLGVEDGFDVYHRKVHAGKGKAAQYVWVTKSEEGQA
jgi:hypothetical protein